MRLYPIKINNIDLQVKDVDTSGRIVQMYVSAFDNKDRDGDVIVKGAFKKTLQEQSDEIWHILFHNPDLPVARPSEMAEDSKGLLFTVPMPNTTRGNDTLQMYLDGHYKKHSIGYRAIKQQKKSDYNEIQEIRLREGSTVLWPANPQADFVGIKGDIKMSDKEIQEEIRLITKSLRNGKYSDETFSLLEIRLLQLFEICKSNETTDAVKSEAHQPEHNEITISSEQIIKLTNIFK